jgi:hypothetical protein
MRDARNPGRCSNRKSNCYPCESFWEHGLPVLKQKKKKQNLVFVCTQATDMWTEEEKEEEGFHFK